jgi:hypothetical protein
MPGTNVVISTVAFMKLADEADAIVALVEEQKKVQAEQLELAAKMAALMQQQMTLSRKQGKIAEALTKLMKR